MDRGNVTGTPRDEWDTVHQHSTVYSLFIASVTVFSLVVAAGLLVGLGRGGVLQRIDFLLCMVLLGDFVATLWRAHNRADYFFRQGGWLDLLGSIPAMAQLPWAATFRLARVYRLMRIVKHLRGKDRAEVLAETRQAPAKTALLSMAIAAFVLITIVSYLVLMFERSLPGAEITSGADAFWWSLATITTVGYGDFVPVTFPGRILAILLMTFGIGIFAVLTSFVAATVLDVRDDRMDSLDAVRDEHAVILAELSEIKEMLKQPGVGREG